MRRILMSRSSWHSSRQVVMSRSSLFVRRTIAQGRRSIRAGHDVPLFQHLNPAVHRFSLSQQSFLSTNSSSISPVVQQQQQEEVQYPDNFYERVELDETLPLSSSVDRLLNIPMGRVHYLDFYNKFPNVLRACCKHGHVERAKQLLERMLEEKRESGRIVPAKVFESLIFGYAQLSTKKKTQVKKTVKNMMDVVALMEQEYDYDYQQGLLLEQQHDDGRDGDSCQPTTNTYNTVLRGLANAAPFLPSAARDAERLLETMENMYQDRRWHTRPNTRSYTYVIIAYGNVGSYDSGNLAEAVLVKMKQIHDIEAKSYEATYSEPYDDLKHARRIITPDAKAYTAVILAHSKSKAKDSAERAYAILAEMHHQNFPPNPFAIVTCIHAFANAANRSSGRGRDRLPAEERARAAERAEALLLTMEDLATRQQQVSNSNEAPIEGNDMETDESDEINEEAIDDTGDMVSDDVSLRPSVIAYNSCLNAWAGSDTREAAPRADMLLQRMIQASMNDPGMAKPNLKSFNTVINAWARFSRYDPKAPEKAEELLNLMYELYYSGRFETVKPDAVTYTCVINAWARSGEREDKVENARRLLEAMLTKYDADEEDMKPNIIAYTSVLNAVVHSPSSSLTVDAGQYEDPFREAPTDSVYSIMLKTYDEIKNDPYNIGLAPDQAAFATMLQAVRQHTTGTSGERRQLIELVFDDACAAGEVSASVIRALRDACPSLDLLERLLRSQKLAKHLDDVSQLPQHWTRNVDFSKRMRKVDGGRGGRQRRQPRMHKNGRPPRIETS